MVMCAYVSPILRTCVILLVVRSRASRHSSQAKAYSRIRRSVWCICASHVHVADPASFKLVTLVLCDAVRCVQLFVFTLLYGFIGRYDDDSRHIVLYARCTHTKKHAHTRVHFLSISFFCIGAAECTHAATYITSQSRNVHENENVVYILYNIHSI